MGDIVQSVGQLATTRSPPLSARAVGAPVAIESLEPNVPLCAMRRFGLPCTTATSCVAGYHSWWISGTVAARWRMLGKSLSEYLKFQNWVLVVEVIPQHT